MGPASTKKAKSQDNGISTEIEYTMRDPKYKNEKPYDLRFDAGEGFPRTNTTNKHHAVLTHDFRPLQSPQSFEEYGFSVEKTDFALSAKVFDDQESIKKMYYPKIKEFIWQRFPNASHVHILEHNLRQRHAGFPDLDPGFEVDYTQPATLTHIVTRVAEVAFATPPGRYQRLLVVNLWKSLQGPGNDWPLALCDRRTIDHASDTMVSDVVYHNRFTENEKVCYNPRHEWYYIKDLRDNEIIMFLQKDSNLNAGGGVAHTSFHNSEADEDAAPRTSIEFRVYVIFA